MKAGSLYLACFLWAGSMAEAEPGDTQSSWNDLPQTAGVHTLVKRAPDPDPARPKGALTGRGLLMPALWHLAHGQLRPRKESDAENVGETFRFDDKGRVYVLVRWRDEFEKQALEVLAKVGGVVADPKQEKRFREDIGHPLGDFRQLDEGKTVVMRGCFVPPKGILELIDQPVIRYIQMDATEK